MGTTPADPHQDDRYTPEGQYTGAAQFEYQYQPGVSAANKAEHSSERERKFPENIEKPGEGLVRNQNVIRSVKEIKDGLLEEAVGITSMETDQEETEQEETKEGNPEETSTYSTNTSRELIEAVGIGIKEILYSTFQGWNKLEVKVSWLLPWLMMMWGAAMILKGFTKVFYWKRWILGCFRLKRI
jgi:hypothetical protein